MTGFEVTQNDAESRYEIHHGDEVAFLEYSRQPWGTSLVHTEVPKDLEGHGYGGALVRHAMEEARRRGEKVIVICPFARTWLQRHPEFDDLVLSAGGPANP